MKMLLNPLREIDAVLLSFRQSVVHVALFSLAINLLLLVPTIYMLQVYDRVLASRNETTLLMLTLLVLALFVLLSFVEFIRSRILVRIGAQLDLALNTRIFTASFESNLIKAGGNPAQSLQDLTTLRQYITSAGVFAFFDAPWSIIFLIVATLLHPLLGLFSLLGVIVLAALAIANEIATRKPLAEAAQQASVAQQYAQNNLRSAEVLEAMGMLGNMRRRWEESQNRFLVLQAVASDRAGTIGAASRFARISFQSLSLGLGAWLALSNEISPGAMIAASVLMGRVLAPVEQAIASSKQLIAARIAYHRLSELLEHFPEREKGMALPAPKGLVTVENATLSPPGSTSPVLRSLAFRINPGDIIGVVGPSAAGKSSLARALVGVWRAQSGHIRLDGADVFAWNKEELGPYVGYLPQDIELFEGTIAENIARFGEVESEKVIAAARRAGVHEVILRMPQGYNTPIGVDGSVLSGGQKQRVALARALYGDPVLVVLDEPNSNLDELGEAALLEALQELKDRSVTVVVITHRTSILAALDKLLLLRDGALTAYGPRDQVLAVIQQGGVGAKPASLGAPTQKASS